MAENHGAVHGVGGAYGAAGSGAQFDPVTFFQRPSVILRIVGWVFSVIVFGCISSQGWMVGACVFNGNPSPCRFGTFVGVIAFLGLLTFLVLTAMFENISNAMHRRYIVMADIGFSGTWSFFWFVCFCFLANQWSHTGDKVNRSAAEGTITFAFFSIIVFVVLTVMAVKQYNDGVGESFQSPYESDARRDAGPSPPYAEHEAYQQSSYPATDPMAATGGYQP